MQKEKYKLAYRYQRMVYRMYPQSNITRDTLLDNLKKCHSRLFPNGSLSKAVETYAFRKIRALPIYRNYRPAAEMMAFYNSNNNGRKEKQKRDDTWKMWACNTSDHECLQQLVESKLEMLIDMYFARADDYQIEKFVKSFCEPIAMIEKSLTRQLLPDITKQLYSKHTIKKSFESVYRAVTSEINRQTRHFNTFLSAVRYSGVAV